jgi:hypothetical protein
VPERMSRSNACCWYICRIYKSPHSFHRPHPQSDVRRTITVFMPIILLHPSVMHQWLISPGPYPPPSQCIACETIISPHALCIYIDDDDRIRLASYRGRCKIASTYFTKLSSSLLFALMGGEVGASAFLPPMESAAPPMVTVRVAIASCSHL